MKKVIIVVVLAIMSFNAIAQVKITGTVKDVNNEPVVGAVVVLEGSPSIGTVTDLDGCYVLTIPLSEDAVLTVSSMSFKSQSVKVGKSQVMDFILEEDSEMLEETVVVGYGMMRKSDLTGSLTSIRIDETDASRSASLDQLMQGRAAGVQISTAAGTDSGVSIRIRGTSTLTGSSEPLYVIDGVIMATNSTTEMLSIESTDIQGTDESVNPLMSINPQDIASIEILKDASATAIYGSEGSNGVVLITTKTASKEKPRVIFSSGLTVSEFTRKLDVLSFDEYVDFVDEADKMNQYLQEQGIAQRYTQATIDSAKNRLYADFENREGLKVNPVDWQDYAYRTAVQQRYFFSVSAAPKSLSYNFSLGYNRSPGLMRTTQTERYTMRLNLTKEFNKKMSIGANVAFSYIDSKMMQGASSYRQNASTSIIRSILTSRPAFSGNMDDILSDDIDETDENESLNRTTPVRWFNETTNTREEVVFQPRLFFKYKILPWLTYEVSGKLAYNYNDRSKYKSKNLNSSGTTGAISQMTYAESLRWTIDNLLMFNKKFNKVHTLSGTLGVTVDSRSTSNQNMLSYIMSQYGIGIDGANSGQRYQFTYNETQINMVSYFLRAIYNYRNRYVLTATYRLDGSCKFRNENVFSSFPSLAAAWRINEESWFNAPVISAAKLRVGWGMVGNSAVSSYSTLNRVNAGKVGVNDPMSESGFIVGLSPVNLANPDLKWETTSQWNVGVDLSMWNGRLALTADAYYKYTYDLLNTKLIPYTSGFQSVWVNQGEISNKGLELSLEAVPLKIGDVELSLNGNLSLNRNRIENIGTDSAGQEIYMTPTVDGLTPARYYFGATPGSGSYGIQPVNVYIEGQPIGLFYGYKTDGIVQSGTKGPEFEYGSLNVGPGGLRLVDPDGDGTVYSTERVIIGDPNPDFTYGFGAKLSWKQLTASISFYGTYGNDICNQNNMILYNTSNMNNKLKKVVADSWTPERPDAEFPRLYAGDSYSNYFFDIYIEDGSFLRLSDISLSYAIPLRKTAVLKNISVGLSAGNVCVWTKYSGYDPEVNSFSYDMKRIGIDNGSFPRARTYSFDLKFTF